MAPRDGTNIQQYYEITWTNLELSALGAFDDNDEDAVADEPEQVPQEESEEDWLLGCPPTTPFVPTPEIIAWMDVLCAILEQQHNLATFGVAFPQDHHYEEFFENFTRSRNYCHDEDDDREDETGTTHTIL